MKASHTIRDFAALSGLGPSHIVGMERGVSMSVESLVDYCRALDLSIDEIVAEDGES